MNAHDVPVVWCVLQATLLAALGAAATWLWARRAPASAAMAAAGSVATILAVTLLVPVPLPRGFRLWPPENAEAPDAMLVEQQPAAEAPLPEAKAGEATRGGSAASGAGVDVVALVDRWLRAVGAGHAAKLPFDQFVERGVVRLALIAAVVGLVRLAASWRFVARLRRSRVAIANPAVAAAFAELGPKLGVRRPVELAESAALASPAVVGWRRPIVLLPAERAGWTEEQLRATLAHELAHVARGSRGAR